MPDMLLAAPENQFSIARWWAQGDAISHAVAILLLAMSLLSWFFIFSKAWSTWRVRAAAPALDAFWAAPNLKDGIALLTLADSEDVFAPLPTYGLAHSAGAQTLAGEMSRDEQVIRVLRQQITRSTQRLETRLDVGDTDGRGDNREFGARRGTALRLGADQFTHAVRDVGVDEQQAHVAFFQVRRGSSEGVPQGRKRPRPGRLCRLCPSHTTSPRLSVRPGQAFRRMPS